MTIAIVYSTPTSAGKKTSFVQTDNDTKIVAYAVSRALVSLGHKTTLHPITPGNRDAIRHIKADCIFNLIEWTGRDMHLVKRAFRNIESLHRPYTGGTYENYINMSDKARMKKIFKTYHIPTPPWQLMTHAKQKARAAFTYPVIIKAAREHCSIGLTGDSLAYNREELQKKAGASLAFHKQPILIEEFIKGREFQVTLVEKNGVPQVLPMEEVFFTSASDTSFLTYDSKWNKKSRDYKGTELKVVKVTEVLARALKRVTLRTFKTLGFRGYSRFDVRTKGNSVYILEANANPNLYDPEEVGQELSYTAAGMTFAQYLWVIVEAAFYHHRRRRE